MQPVIRPSRRAGILFSLAEVNKIGELLDVHYYNVNIQGILRVIIIQTEYKMQPSIHFKVNVDIVHDK
jgi:hypothetical protein